MTLLASNDEGLESPFSSTITITDPDEALTILTGTASKTWKLYREGTSVSLGPNASNPAGWWNGLTNDGSRNCLYEQIFTFERDRSYVLDDQGGFWDEFGPFSDTDVFETCFDAEASNMVAADGTDLSAWLSATHQYNYDVSAGTLTLTREGAWIGIPKLGTDGVHDTTIVNTVTSNISISEEDGFDLMYITFDYGDTGGDGLWSIVYVSYDDDDDASEPDLAVSEPAPSFSYAVDGLDVTFTNSSSRADTYSWDFGDGASSTDESPIHTYAEEGTYSVILSATENGITNTNTQDIIINTAEFSADVLSSESGKAWTLAGAGSYKAGPNAGSGEWWGGISEEDVTTRSCQIDDEYIFSNDGGYSIDLQSNTWVSRPEIWLQVKS